MNSTVKLALGVGCGALLAMGVVVVGCFGLAGLGMARSNTKRAQEIAAAKAAPVVAAEPTYQLELVGDWRPHCDSAYCYVEGEVRNVTSEPLRAVQAVARWYSPTNEYVTSDTAIVGLNPLPAGESSPFRVTTKRAPSMDNAKLSFRLFTGQALSLKPSP